MTDRNPRVADPPAAPSEASHAWLGERLTEQVLAIFAQTFGSYDRLLRDGEMGLVVSRLLGGGARDLAPADLARLSNRAIVHLAAQDSLNAGREPLRPADWRVILYGLTSARTLREAIHHCIDCFEAIDGRCGHMSLRTRGDATDLLLDARRPARTVLGCVIDLFGIAQNHQLLGWLIGQTLPLEQVWLDHDPATFAALGLPDLPAPVVLDAGSTGFRFPTGYLDHPVVRSTGEMMTRPSGTFLFGGPTDQARDSLAGEVRRIALDALRNQQRLPAFEDVAKGLQMSIATLRRRLTDEGASYREIKDSCRRELGLDLLRRSSLPIEEIAVRLDFCDSDAFRRAFHDWLGIPPSRYRREALAEG